MKSVSTLILLIAGLALGYIAFSTPGPDREVRSGLAPDAPIPSTLEGDVPTGYVARSLDVDGMCCSGCPRTLYERLIAVEGVVSAAVSFDEGTASAVCLFGGPLIDGCPSLENGHVHPQCAMRAKKRWSNLT